MVQLPEVVPPAIPKPELLEAVKPPDLQPSRPPAPPEMKFIELPVQVTPVPFDLSKVVLPVSSAESIRDVAPPQLAMSTTESVSAPLTAPAPNQPNVPDSPVTKRVEALLTLSPMPSPPDDTVKIPAGEARGRFSISPDPNLTGSDKEGRASREPVW